MYENFKKEHNGLSLKDKLWAAARATHVNQFKFEMESLKELDKSAYKWLALINPSHWSKSYFRTSPKCDLLLNNLSETFNSVILDARSKPLIGMIETIRIYLQKRLHAKREYIEKYDGLICPKVQGKLDKLKDQSRICIGSHAGGGRFEVRDMFGGRYAVNICEMTCSCRSWNLTGIPCIHGVCAIAGSGRDPEAYVHKYYSKEMFRKAYQNILEPVKSPPFWPRTNRALLVHLEPLDCQADRKEQEEKLLEKMLNL